MLLPPMVPFVSVSRGETTAKLPLLPTPKALKPSSLNDAATMPGTMNVVIVLVELLKSHKRCSEGNGSTGAPVDGSLAELEIRACVPSGDTASTTPIGTGVARVTV